MREFAGWMRALRPHVKAVIDHQADRADLWERIFTSDVVDLVENGDLSIARTALADILGAELAQHLPEVS
jgi:hypothetical protein